MQLPALKKAVGVVLYHCSESDTVEQRHHFCPTTPDSWCKYQADKINGTTTFIQKPGLPIAVRDKIQPIFVALSDDSLLSRCLHGKTQNNNESLNGMTWQRCSKEIYVGHTVLEMAISSVVLSFNCGFSGILHVMEHYGLRLDIFVRPSAKKETDRIQLMNKKCIPEVKYSRKKLSAKGNGFNDKDQQNEGTVYSAGLFLTLRNICYC